MNNLFLDVISPIEVVLRSPILPIALVIVVVVIVAAIAVGRKKRKK